ncbi:RNA exonuclease Rex3 [Penicillium cosmopolitanum]|uniref:RNA exonuclease Rex3 n=1 Tax=Penicillium cosmopolitanum TaxID=1131564 RepID=A0A9W9VP31_9EURO|nr:RNA exonuclease Rex3 [Penicillium cosmopolitanum]KAJ5386681.1 RNA exonuclease Rex3 [Penicillium cosmopolitanum]
MFQPLGLFAEIPCPRGQECDLFTCMFNHDKCTLATASRPSNAAAILSDESGHVSKKQRLGEVNSAQRDPSTSLGNQQYPKLPTKTPLPTLSSKPQSQGTRGDGVKLPSASRNQQHGPLSRRHVKEAPPPRKVRKESLNPRMLTKAPATHAVRSAILDKLHGAMSTLNTKLVSSKDESNKCFVLNRDELVTMALDEEEKVARDNYSVYSNIIKLRIVKLTKMKLEDWTDEVKTHLNTRYYKIKPIEPTQAAPTSPPIDTGLSVKEEIAIATHLITSLDGLEEYGYVTKAPSEAAIETAKQGVSDSKGWEKCERCGGRFQVFPGRREDGALASGGQCTYHPSRPFHPPRKRTDNVTGSSETYFPCCSETVGTSSGCTKANTHVFKVSETKRLASLIRLTAVSWPEGRELLDVLVKPMGEVLDLNSRFSGVFPEHYASAVPYGIPIPKAASSDSQLEKSKSMQVVESPAVARELLLNLLQPDTPLIAHAIDNDLNACRIIHPTVIDTVILYPNPAGGLPLRVGLKALARRFLERDIQTGGNQGHDSKEDSIATGDLVRVKVRELWKRLKAKGWKFENNELIPPAGEDTQSLQAHKIGISVSPGAGFKRKRPPT